MRKAHKRMNRYLILWLTTLLLSATTLAQAFQERTVPGRVQLRSKQAYTKMNRHALKRTNAYLADAAIDPKIKSQGFERCRFLLEPGG